MRLTKAERRRVIRRAQEREESAFQALREAEREAKEEEGERPFFRRRTAAAYRGVFPGTVTALMKGAQGNVEVRRERGRVTVWIPAGTPLRFLRSRVVPIAVQMVERRMTADAVVVRLDGGMGREAPVVGESVALHCQRCGEKGAVQRIEGSRHGCGTCRDEFHYSR